MKNLSTKEIDFNEITHGTTDIKIADLIESYNWHDCPITGIESVHSRNYFKLFLHNGAILPVGKKGKCFLRRIESGLLEGCYCVKYFETGLEDYLQIYVLHKNKVINFASSNNDMSFDEIDKLFEQAAIESILAKKLNKIDLLARVQDCELFYEKLPLHVVTNETFIKNVLDAFEMEGQIKVKNDVDLSLINLDACKEKNRSGFVKFQEKCRQKQEKTK